MLGFWETLASRTWINNASRSEFLHIDERLEFDGRVWLRSDEITLKEEIHMMFSL